MPGGTGGGTRSVTKVVAAGGAAPNAVDVSYTGIASDTVDLIGTALAVALNATVPIAGAAYVGGTNVLTIAQTTDNLGDRSVEIEITPPGCVAPIGGTFFYTALTHRGAVGAALSVNLTDSAAIPKLIARV